ncbi:sugar transferase [Pleurocapsa sp. PCC 7319]|uniref:sugar transferase n=1 Tax=Pleurocapsa sp. PCC 7319 TaxID=118161 RepID=UPI00034512E5|nr:sugar transferase [Pleurocapsa sp. PCC 7319]
MSRLIKNIADRLAAAIALLIFSPLILIVALLIRFKLGSPIFFTQLRPGKDGKIFTFYKFRTMTDAKDEDGNLLPDGDRITPLGAWLRKTSLDELPQVLNVLKGDMSFVGPRPLLVRYLELYNDEQARRHDVLPGITGWAQVNGRRNLDGDFLKKFQLDVWYINNWSLWLDFKIIWLTVLAVIVQKDIDQDGYTTGGGEFLGNDQ